MTTRKFWPVLAAFTTLSVFVVASGSPATASTPADTAVRSLDEAGILAGTNCSSEACDGDLLRWEAAFWLAKALELGPARTVASEDVPAGGNLADAVSAVVREGVTVGCASEPLRFCPDSHTTRAQMASFLARAFDLRASRLRVFTDVDRGSVHAGNISAIRRAGITRGCSEEPLRYCPHDSVSRRQAAVMLYRALERHDADADSSRQDSTTGPGPTSPTFNIPIIPIATIPSTTTTIPTTTTTIPTTTTTVPTTTTTVPPARPDCVVVDHRNDHHDISDHGGDPDGEISYALLPDGTLFGHRHDHGDAKCWMWAPPDDNGNTSRPQDAQPPSHTH